MDDAELSIVNEAAAAAVEAAMRRQPGWRMIPGNVVNFDTGTFQASVIPDGATQPITAYVAVGVPIRPGDRVLVTFTNPGGAFVTGFVGMSRAIVGELSLTNYGLGEIPPGGHRYLPYWEMRETTIPSDWGVSPGSPWIQPAWPGWYFVSFDGNIVVWGYATVLIETEGHGAGLFTIAGAEAEGSRGLRGTKVIYVGEGGRFRFRHENAPFSTTGLTPNVNDFTLAYLGSTPEGSGTSWGQ